MKFHCRRLLLLLVLLVPQSVAAKTITCNPGDPTGNTSLLCSGDPCEVTSQFTIIGDCTLDFGLRALVIRGKKIEAKGSTLEITAGSITGLKIGSSSSFISVKGSTTLRGGTLRLTSLSSIDINGTLMASGSPGGSLFVIAGGDVVLDGFVLANGISLDSAGGNIVISAAQDLRCDSNIRAESGDGDAGGTVTLTAARNLTQNGKISVKGGEFSGGVISLLAGDDVVVTGLAGAKRGSIDASSGARGGDGGSIEMIAGSDAVGGEITGGTLSVIANIELDVSASAAGPGPDAFAGDGGDVFLQAFGDMYIDAGAKILSHGAAPDGSGGDVFVLTAEGSMLTIGPRDGDLDFRGQVLARGLGVDSDGGDTTISAGRDLTVGKIDVSSKWVSGDFACDAGGAIHLTGKIIATGGGSDGDGGLIDVSAGLASVGVVSVDTGADMVARGGSLDGPSLGGDVSIVGCAIDVATQVEVDSRGGFGADGRLFGGDITVAAPTGVTLRGNFQSQLGGKIYIVHPSAFPPDTSGATFDTPVSMQVADFAPLYPMCGVVPTPIPTPSPTPTPSATCGNGLLESGEVCDDGNTLDGDCCDSLCQQVAADGSSCPSADPCVMGSCFAGDCVLSAVADCTHLGDIDCNGQMNSSDALTSLCLFVGICDGANLPAPCSSATQRLAVADWDLSGQIDSSDSLTSLGIFVGLVSQCSTPLGVCCCP